MTVPTPTRPQPSHFVRVKRTVAAAMFAAAPIAAALGAVFVAPARAEQAAEAPAAPTIPSVTVATASISNMVGRVAVSGTLVPLQEILVYPEVSGYILQNLSVDVGDSVSAGDVLATLNDGTLRAQLAQSQAAYASAQASLRQAESQIESADATADQATAARDRTQALRTSGTATQATLDQAIAAALTADAQAASARDGLLAAQAQVQQAQASLDIAQMNLDHATLRAPVDGIVTARNGQIGSIAASGGEPIFKILAGGTVELEAEVIETALAEIAVDDVATVQVSGLGDISGKVRRIAPTVDPATRLGAIRISLDTTNLPGLRAGLFASGWIVTEERLSISVPTTAVLSDTGGNFVLVVQDGVLEKRAVVAGLIWQGQREILQGLAEGEIVVAKAGAFFGEGDRINPVVPAPALPSAAAPAATPSADETAAADGDQTAGSDQ